MISKGIILQESKEEAFVRGVAAIGICSAWLELICIIGRYPFYGGDFKSRKLSDKLGLSCAKLRIVELKLRIARYLG